MRKGAGEGPLAAFASRARGPQWTLPSSRKQGICTPLAEAPGPGHYAVEGAYKALRSGRYRESSFPKAKTVVKAADESPGISYTERPEQRHVPGGVLPRSATRLVTSASPGPEYCPRSTLSGKGAVSMGTVPWLRTRRRPASAPADARREDTSTLTITSSTSRGSAAPAPVRGFSFGSSKRLPDHHEDTPGISYVPPSTLRPRSASCLNGHRPEQTKLELRPGPHTYEPSKPSSARTVRFGNAQRCFSEPGRTSSALGPGAYAVTLPERHVKCHRIASPTRPSSSEEFEEPGPGAYDPAMPWVRGGGNCTTFARAPREPKQQDHSHLSGERRAQIIRSFFRAGGTTAASMRRGPRLPPRRLAAAPKCGKAAKACSGPGPGAFDLRGRGNKRSCVFGTAPRVLASELAEGPGPGEYADFPSKNQKGGKLRPKSASTRPVNVDSGPAPGDYKVYRLFPC
mmetsp:Transcript_63863/g.149705  ORF Transcript_63863/g.149705 Transcript_63863/m.149705 type:complete len:457 (-) Transcript_63863:176-1546(-)